MTTDSYRSYFSEHAFFREPHKVPKVLLEYATLLVYLIVARGKTSLGVKLAIAMLSALLATLDRHITEEMGEKAKHHP